MLIVRALFVEFSDMLVPLLISSASIVNPPILPPVNKTDEPVMSPSAVISRLVVSNSNESVFISILS